MRPAGGLANASGLVPRIEPRVRIRRERAREVAPVNLGMLTLAIG
jgi:hypothetical protein